MKLLQNNNIRLRAPEPEDLDVFFRWENDTTLWKYGATLSPYSRYALKEYLSNIEQNIYQNNQLRFMIEEVSGSVPAGTIDLYDFEPHHSRAGVGILIDETFRKRGIASGAIELISEYAFSFLNIHQLYAHIPVSNTVSIALFKKNGFTASGILKDWIRIGEEYEEVYIMQRITDKGHIK